MIWPFRKPPPWVYLGYTELLWSDAPTNYVHFYARGDDFKDRKVDVSNSCTYHKVYQKKIIPWLKDPNHNLWSPIDFPSASLQEYTEKSCGFKLIDNKWVKPVPKVERDGNVISMLERK